MDAFDKWALEYAPSNRADCEAAYRAGMRRAAEVVAEQPRRTVHVAAPDIQRAFILGCTTSEHAILKEIGE